MTDKSVTVKSFADISKGLAEAKKARAADTAAISEAMKKGENEDPILENQPEPPPFEVSELAETVQAAETALTRARLETPLIPPVLSVPKTPEMQSMTAPVQTAIGPQSSGQSTDFQSRPVRPGQRREDRVQMEEMSKPPVALTPEQQELCAWMYLRRQRESEKLMIAERRLGVVSQIVSIGVGILTIVGGILAVRQGLRAAANDYKQ